MGGGIADAHIPFLPDSHQSSLKPISKVDDEDNPRRFLMTHEKG